MRGLRPDEGLGVRPAILLSDNADVDDPSAVTRGPIVSYKGCCGSSAGNEPGPGEEEDMGGGELAQLGILGRGLLGSVTYPGRAPTGSKTAVLLVVLLLSVNWSGGWRPITP